MVICQRSQLKHRLVDTPCTTALSEHILLDNPMFSRDLCWYDHPSVDCMIRKGA